MNWSLEEVAEVPPGAVDEHVATPGCLRRGHRRDLAVRDDREAGRRHRAEADRSGPGEAGAGDGHHRAPERGARGR